MTGLTKVSANFSSRSVASLELAAQVTGDNETDCLNRAIQLYAHAMEQIRAGKVLQVIDPVTGIRERLPL